jgi:hypothetical protein
MSEMKKYSIGNGKKSETKLQHLLSLPNKSRQKKSNRNSITKNQRI